MHIEGKEHHFPLPVIFKHPETNGLSNKRNKLTGIPFLMQLQQNTKYII